MESGGVSVKVQYIGAPRYRIVVRAPDYKSAEEEIQKAANRVMKGLTAKGSEAKFHRRGRGDAVPPPELPRVPPIHAQGELAGLRPCAREPAAAPLFLRRPVRRATP